MDVLTGRRVLVVDDEPMVREVVAAYLRRDGFMVSEAADGVAAVDAFRRDRPNLVILDVMLPGRSGLDVMSEITPDVPVILLTARADEADRVVGLELGADDYLVKPFSPRELVARVKSVLRRLEPPTRTALHYRGLDLDPATRQVLVEKDEVHLTAKEFDLLAFLASSPKQVFSRRQLLDQVWDSAPEYQDASTVTVHIRRIRGKIEPDPSRPRWIQTVRGVGYRFSP